jgi:hypothetical protein
MNPFTYSRRGRVSVRTMTACMAAALGALLVAACGGSSGTATEGDSVAQSDEALRARLCDGPLHLRCAEGQYCNSIRAGVCPGPRQFGVCAAEAQICPDIFQPVCGCDGQTYPNACHAAAAGVAVAHTGACAPAKTMCGGIAGIQCPGSGRCVDDPSDSCDPTMGGADCSGICTCIETQLCIQGDHFDSDPSVCACVPN